MPVDSLLVVLSLISFVALIVIWVAAPLHAEEVLPSTTAEPAQNSLAA
jgi:hypothetical protein